VDCIYNEVRGGAIIKLEALPMSGGTVTPPLSQQSPLSQDQANLTPDSPLEALIEDRILRTRRQVKGVDVISALMALAIGAVAYLFAAALIDHWVIAGGLGFWGRLLLWAILIFAAGLYVVKHLWPMIVHRVNPVFAAQTIEQSKPSFKNSLINFLLMRGHRRELAPVIYQALEQRAATDIKQVQIEVAVDRKPILQLSYLLAAVVTAFCLYLALSPKSPLTSAARVLWPWSDLHAPTRVTIDDVQPGNASAYYGDFVAVSAEVRGLKEGEQALLHYSTADGETLDQIVPMSGEEGKYLRQAQLPPGNRGLQQNYSYFIAAGDFQTDTYKITVQIAPEIDVDKVDYHYPPYTGIPDRSVERQGEIEAIEGTEVVIHATANQPIERAEIDFSGGRLPGIRMNVDDRSARGQFTLRFHPDDPARQEYDFYQLRFRNTSGQDNRQPIRHGIEVLRDRPPIVEILQPQREEAAVAEDGNLEIRLRAEDDFGLRRVAIRAQEQGRTLSIAPLLDAKPPEKAFGGEFIGKYDFQPARLGLKAGDRVSCWAEADDNKEPAPNLSASNKQVIIVTAPEKPPAPDQQPHRARRPGEKADQGAAHEQPSDQRSQEKPPPDQQQENQAQPQNQSPTKPGEKDRSADQAEQESRPGGQQSATDQSQSGEQGKAAQTKEGGGKGVSPESDQNSPQGAGQQVNKAPQPIDPDANPGDAIQEILKHRQEEQQQEQQKTQSAEAQREMQSQPGDQKSGEQQSGSRQSGNQQEGKQQPLGEQSAGSRESSSRQQGTEQPGKQQADQQPTGQQPDKGQPSGPQQSAGDQQAEGQQAEGQQAEGQQQQKGRQAEGQQQGAAEKSGDQQQAGQQKTSGDQQPGSEKNIPPNQLNGEKQPAGGKQGSDQQAQEKPAGEKQTGQKQSTQRQTSPEKQSSGEPQTPGAEQPTGEKTTDKTQPNAAQPFYPQGQKQPTETGQNQNQPPEQGELSRTEQGQSPSTSKKPSEAQGQQAGDRSGAGEKGGGQQGQKSGAGVEGSHTPADEGGSRSNQQGPGELGQKPGHAAQSRQPTGSAAKQQGEQGATGQKQPGQQEPGGKQQPSPDSSAGQAQQNQPEGGQPGTQPGQKPGAQASGNPTGGGQQGTQPGAAEPGETEQLGADQINLDFARKQTNLALEHLEDQMAKNQPELLERLGWTREQAQRFLSRWQEMEKAAAEKGPQGQAAKQRFDDALKSLGLRPGTTFLKHGTAGSDQLQDLRDSGRFAPPAQWAEQFREYTRGVAEGGKEQQTEEGK
jgi:collagen type III alpha